MLIIPESPLRLWGSLLGCVGFTVVGVVLILTSNQSSSPLLHLLAGIASIGFFGIICTLAIVRKLLSQSRLIVTPEGVRLERRKGQSFIVNESARWADIAEFFGQEIAPGGTRAQLVIGYILRGSAKSMGGCLISSGSGVLMWCGVTCTVTMKASTQSRPQRGHAANVILHHDRLVAPAPGPGSQERG